jgi:hypothetical protein
MEKHQLLQDAEQCVTRICRVKFESLFTHFLYQITSEWSLSSQTAQSLSCDTKLRCIRRQNSSFLSCPARSYRLLVQRSLVELSRIFLAALSKPILVLLFWKYVDAQRVIIMIIILLLLNKKDEIVKTTLQRGLVTWRCQQCCILANIYGLCFIYFLKFLSFYIFRFSLRPHTSKQCLAYQ